MSTVFRVEKKANFTVMSNTHLKDRRLTYKAKGLLSVILSLPPEWDYTVTGLAHIACDGVESVKTAVRELERFGYITRRQTRDERGRMSANEYLVYEDPADNPEHIREEALPAESAPAAADAAAEPAASHCAEHDEETSFSVTPSADFAPADKPSAENSSADTIIILNIDVQYKCNNKKE